MGDSSLSAGTALANQSTALTQPGPHEPKT
jgi:hypothetical protein